MLAENHQMIEHAGANARVLELQARIHSMQATTLDERALPTLPALASVLPGGALRQGSVYSVAGSMTLAMAMLAAPSAGGAWCGVVGVPDFGVEAAARLGIELERLVLAPSPGDQWLTVTAALVDVLTVVVTRPPRRVGDADAARLSARLRQRGATLVVLGDWPQSEATLRAARGAPDSGCLTPIPGFGRAVRTECAMSRRCDAPATRAERSSTGDSISEGGELPQRARIAPVEMNRSWSFRSSFS